VIASICFFAACTETVVEDVQQEAEKVYRQENITEVDVMPEFAGGMEALISYMSTSVEYPAAAKEEGLTGTVYVRFVVDSQGSITELEVVKGVRDDLDSEAVRAISEMPKWKPGKSNGKNVSVEVVLPIRFVLS
ncbi:MAG: energy transducer TonB, partial [Flavobacteriales bacterium]|nr:energy transducer TonB [Flavobacteriales bacterium]